MSDKLCLIQGSEGVERMEGGTEKGENGRMER